MTENTLDPSDIAHHLALEVIDTIGRFRFEKLRPIPMTSGNLSGAAVDVAESIVIGADLDVLSKFPQDYIFKGQSVLHMLATVQPQSYDSRNYELIEEAVRLLVEPAPTTGLPRFDLEQADGVHGFTPLHYASCYGSPRMVETLLSAGARADALVGSDAEHSTFAGCSPVDLALRHNRKDIAQMIHAHVAGKAIEGIVRSAANSTQSKP